MINTNAPIRGLSDGGTVCITGTIVILNTDIPCEHCNCGKRG